MIRRWSVLITSLWCAIALAGCNGSSNSTPVVAPQPTATGGGLNNTGLQLKKTVTIPSVPAGGGFSYDIGTVDPSSNRFYLADRTSKAIDIIDTSSFALRQAVGPFTGAGASTEVSGPNGLVVIPGSLVYVGDVNNVKVVDPTAGTIVQTIPTSTSGARTDEGCYDGDDKLIMISNPADTPPFESIISPASNVVTAKIPFASSSGLEACVYDAATKNFLVNNDGTTANPQGELDVIPASSVVAGTPTVSAVFPEGNCGPSGLALGPNQELLIGCDPPAGEPEITLIMNAQTGAILKTITQVGGADEVAYDPHYNRFYTASRDMTASGTAGGTTTPVLGVIDAAAMTWLGNIPMSSAVHSVAVDPATGHVFVPLAPTATTPGGVNIYGLAGAP